MFSRTWASPSGVGSNSSGITLPPEIPSSTTSVKRTLGVNSDITRVRSTPGMKKTSSVASRRTSKYSRVKMSPSRVLSAMTTRLAPPN